MSDKAVDVITEAVRRVQTFGPFIDGFQGFPESYTSVILDALKAAGIALVELQSVDGLRFTHEDGTPYSPDELRHFAGEALAAAAVRDE